jgi:outer membrane protein TolC
LLLAVKEAKLNIQEAKQNTTGAKINLVSDVSKAFYDLLLSIEQISVYKEDTARLKKNQADAYNGYLGGVVDKVDYKQATIALNNSMSQLNTATEAVQAKYATLKLLMGCPSERKFTVHFDTTKMMQDIYIDTNEHLDFEKRIEYQELQTAKKMQQETTMYYQLGFLPSLSAFYNYNYEFQSNSFSSLYDHAYPYSLFGLQLNIPIFTGLRRNENIHKAKLQEQRIDWDEVNLKLAIYAQYSQALANYKSNVYYLHEQGDNVDMAREVYNIVKLQYREGVKAYLDVIIAESDLQTSEINYLNALFQVLGSKIDLEKAMGDIPTNI